MSGNIPRLEFNMQLAGGTGWQITEGTLLIKKDVDNAGVKLRATSGLAGYQKAGDWRIKGRGYIPPSKQLIPQQWSVSTQRLYMPDVKGVEGSFYAISPFEIRLPGVARGDFGIHFGANLPGCFDINETYVLTPDGWIDTSFYDGSLPIAQMGEHGVLLWDLPKRVIKEYYSGKMIKHSANKMEMLVTPNDRIAHIPSSKISKGALNYIEAQTAYNRYREISIPISGILHGSKAMPEYEAKLFIAFLADGYHQNKQTCWHLKKSRKIERLKSILEEGKIDYKEYQRSNESVEIKIPKLDFLKDFQPEIALEYCLTTKLVMLREIVYWDGTESGNKKLDKQKKYSCYVSSTVKSQIDFFELLAITSGMSCTRREFQDERNSNWSRTYTNLI